MPFEEHSRTLSLYQTDDGSLAVTTHTSQLINDIGENGGKLSIDYTVEIDSNLAGTHRFEMAVTPAGKMQ